MTEAVAHLTEGRRGWKAGRPFSPIVVLCLGFIGMVALAVVAGPMIAPHDSAAQDVLHASSGPGSEHWLGTDALGRDVFSRLLVGARSAFVGPLLIAVGSMVCGNLLGLLAGYRGGIADSIIMRCVDLMIALPSLLVIIVVAGALGGGYWLAVVALTVLTVPLDTRVIRAATLEQMPRPYVEAAKTVGVSGPRILLWHIWPNVSAVAVANTFLVFSHALIAISSLSFLGLGSEPGTPDWGQMLAENQPLLFTNAVASIAPGICIVLTATAMSLIGDWIHDRVTTRGATR